MSKFEVIRGVKDYCLALDAIIHAWESDEEYKAANTQSRYAELFGTPERAARTFADFCDKCDKGECNYCPLDKLTDFCIGYDALLEWLKQEVEA